MTLKQYIEELAPVNTTEKVDKLLLFIKTSKLFFDEQADYEILMAIKKLSIQRYYVDNKPDFDIRMPPPKVVRKQKHSSKSKISLQIALVKDILNDNGDGKKNKRKGERVNKILKNSTEKKTKHEDIKGKEKTKYAKYNNEVVSGRYHVSNQDLKNLVKNGRDYSCRHPTIAGAKRNAARRTKEQQKEFDWKNRPHIIYTPMGGQNKKY